MIGSSVDSVIYILAEYLTKNYCILIRAIDETSPVEYSKILFNTQDFLLTQDKLLRCGNTANNSNVTYVTCVYVTH